MEFSGRQLVQPAANRVWHVRLGILLSLGEFNGFASCFLRDAHVNGHDERQGDRHDHVVEGMKLSARAPQGDARLWNEYPVEPDRMAASSAHAQGVPVVQHADTFVSPEFSRALNIAPWSVSLSHIAQEADATGELVVRYTREVVTQVLDEYSDLTGLGITPGDRPGGKAGHAWWSSRHRLGVRPVTRLKATLKYSTCSKPVRSAMRASARSVVASRDFTRSSRTRTRCW